MKLDLTLSQKGLALVLIPLFFQLVCFIGLFWVQTKTDEEAARAYRANKISDSVDHLVRDMFEIASASQNEVLNITNLHFEDCANRIRKDIRITQEAVEGDRAKETIVAKTKEAAENAYNILESVQQVYSANGPLAAFEELKKFRMELRFCAKRMVSPELLAMADTELNYQTKSHYIQSGLRQKFKLLLLGGFITTILLTGGIAWIFYRDIVKRIGMVTENSYRLASSMPLQPAVGGNDEIAILDRTFHQMSSTLAYMKRREKALIEHSLDLVCSLDEGLKFTALNPACENVLGYKPSELLGLSVGDLFVEEDRRQAQKALFKAIVEETKLEFEARMLHKQGKVIEVFWKVNWVRLEKLVFCVVHDVTVRKQAEKMRQEVVAMVSHDLRTPLATVSSYFEMLFAGIFGEISERGQHLAKVAERSMGRMLSLTNDLLDIEKSKSGLLTIQPSPVNLNELIDQSVKSVASLALRQEVYLKTSETNLVVMADYNRVMQVLVNLISNAIKFSPKQGTVSVGSEEKNGKAYIYVADEGRGVPDTLKQTIFERFHQVEIADAVDKGGSGLGLAICKALVELHGGEIKVENNGDKGSIFLFSLPLSNEAVDDIKKESGAHIEGYLEC